MLINILYDVIPFFLRGREQSIFKSVGRKERLGMASDRWEEIRINTSYSEGYSEGILGRERSSARI